MAIIWRPNNMRTYVYSSPSEVDADYWDVPCWTPIHILNQDPVWCRIQIGHFIGYIKTKDILGGVIDHEGKLDSTAKE